MPFFFFWCATAAVALKKNIFFCFSFLQQIEPQLLLYRIDAFVFVYTCIAIFVSWNWRIDPPLSLSHSSLPFFYLCCSKEAGACVCQCEGEVRRQAERRWYFTTLFVTRRRGLPSSLFFFLLSSFFFLGVECFDRVAKEYYNKPEGRWSSGSTLLTSSHPTKTV